MRLRVLAIVVASLLPPASASPMRQPEAVVGSRFPDARGRRADAALDPARQAALADAPAWRSFQSRHGAWKALWNERTGTPHLAFGPAIPLSGRAHDGPAVDRAVRAFIAENAALLGGAPPALRTLRVTRAGAVWYLSYAREVGGVPVLFEDWEFRVGAAGHLMAFGVDAHEFPPAHDATPRLGAAEARLAAGLALGLPGAEACEGGETLWWLPGEPGHDPRLVREVRARTASPPGSWVILVDARSGEIAWRHDRLRYQVSGAVVGDVHVDLPTGTSLFRFFARQQMVVGATVTYTDPAGSYSAPAAGAVTVTGALQGPFCNVNRQDAPDAAFSASVTAPATVDVTWTDANSHAAERDGFYHVTLAHEHYKALDPGFTGNDYSMPCTVNIGLTCNATWDGTGVNFYTAGGGCPNTATMPDVVYHEYGHGVNDNLYLQEGAFFGMVNGALHEGMADVAAAFIQDTPDMGKGFLGPGTILRTLDNTARWPENASGDPHITGLIVAGAFWDLRQALGLATAERLSHFAKYALPDDGNDGNAMSEMFVAVLVADDDDGNLANGTPNDDAIATAFNAHGIGTQQFLVVGHSPLDDQFGVGPYAALAQIQYNGPVGALDPASPRLHYSVNGSSFAAIPMSSLGSGEYSADIPAPTGTIVRYYITAADNFGVTKSHPVDPAKKTHVFLAGPTTSWLIHDHESDAGWTVGFPGDDAVTGIWQWEVPQGSFVGGQPVQPDADHSSGGIACYLTANPVFDTNPGAHDVDGGRTTVMTSLFDATLAGPHPVLEYWRWYTNDLGASPGLDFWSVYITNDAGASWTPVEFTQQSDNSWRRVVFFVETYVTPTPLTALRFVAADEGDGSLVEAAVDDMRLLAFDSGVTAVNETAPATLLLAAPAPNPSAGRTHLHFALPAQGRASLGVFDLAGRRVRVLVDGVTAAGPHSVAWDGRDDGGRPVASGLYLARLEASGQVCTQRVVRSR